MIGFMWRSIQSYPKLAVCLGALLALWIGAEIADPLPNGSLWRYIRTDHRVHVLIEAEVDGEAVKLERNFRCYWDHRPALSYDLPSGRRLRQAGAVIGATLKDGRYVSVSLPSLCIRPAVQGNHYTQTGIPIFRVADRLRDPTRIEVQVDPDAVLSGRNGVKLLSILIENPAPASVPVTPDWMESDYQELDQSFRNYYEAHYVQIRPRYWWNHFPEVAALLNTINVAGSVDGLPGIQAITHDVGPDYIPTEGWLSGRNGQGNYIIYNPKLVDTHPVRPRNGVRVIDTQVNGIVEFTPWGGPNKISENVNKMPFQLYGEYIETQKAVYSIFEPKSGSLLSVEEAVLANSLEGQ